MRSESRLDVLGEVLFVVGVGKHLAGNQKRRLGQSRRIERMVKALLGADSTQGQRKSPLGVVSLQLRHRHAIRDFRQHRLIRQESPPL